MAIALARKSSPIDLRRAGRGARRRRSPRESRARVRSLPASAKRISGWAMRQALDHIGDRRRLGPLRLQELEPRRRREEEVAHLDPRSRAERRRPDRRDRGRLRPRSRRLRPRPLRARRATAAPPRRSPPAPRRGSRASGCRRARRPSLEVQWRSTASARSSRPDAAAVVADPDQRDAARGGDDLDPRSRRRRWRSRPAP